MPKRSEYAAPKIDVNRPRELPRYFEELEQLMAEASITIDADKKKQAVYYADYDTEQTWRSFAEFDDNTSTYNSFKKAILRHYPDASGEFLYSIRDVDLLIGERQRLGINSIQDLSDFHLPFIKITTWLIKRNQLAEIEQNRAYIRAFQPQLLSPIMTELRYQIRNHHPNVPHKVDDVYEAARGILQEMPSFGFTGSTQPKPVVAEPAEPPIKIETLAPYMAEYTKMIIDALKGANFSQRQIDKIIECIMCGGNHTIPNCPTVEDFIKAGKCRRNHENKVVLPNGSFVPRHIIGRTLAERIDEWHRQNPSQQSAVTMVHTIEDRFVQGSRNLPVPYRQYNTAYTLSGDERIATMEAEIYNIRKSREVGMVKTRAQQKAVPRLEEVDDEDDQPSQPAASTSNSQPIIQGPSVPTRNPTVSIPNIQPTIPEHPYRNARDAAYAPPVNRNVAVPDKFNNGKRPEPAYKTLPPIHDPTIAANVFKRSMDTPIVISHRELLSMSPEVRSQYRDCTTTRRMPYNNGNTAQNYLDTETEEAENQQLLNTVAETQYHFAESLPNSAVESSQNQALPAGALILPDPIETYYNSLPYGESPDPSQLVVAVESGAVRTVFAFIDNKEQKECILDPGCQVVAMSETTCHQLGLSYDPSIVLNMVSANGNVNQSLGLARNVPFQIGTITFYLQVHIIQSPAYDVLLGRPFDILTESVVRNFVNQDQTITITDPNTGRIATVPTLTRTLKHQHHSHNQKERDF